MDCDPDVKTYKDVPARRMMSYRVRRVVSPSEFYLEYARYPEQLSYSKWFPDMQWFYKVHENQDRLKLKKNRAVLGRCYVTREVVSGQWQWHRVRVHELKGDRTASVYFMDLDIQKTVEFGNLFELDPLFAAPAVQIFRAYLFDIRKKEPELRWSGNASEYFKDLVDGREFLGIVLARSYDQVTNDMPDFITTLGIVLIENSPASEGLCTLNARMVDKGYAASCGPFGACKHVGEIPGYVPSFQGPKPADDEDDESDEELEIEEEHNWKYYENATCFIPREFVDHMAHVEIKYVLSPNYIVAHLYSKGWELDAMHEQIASMVKDEQSLKNGTSGMLVACHLIKDRDIEDSEDGIWCRGIIVLKGKKAGVFKVLLTDFGFEMMLGAASLRPLPETFCQVPSFAIRIHLDVENLRPANPVWGSQATQGFREYCCTWDGCQPRYFMFQPHGAETLKLDYFSQAVIFKNNKWVPSQVGQESSTDKAIDSMKTHPMLYSLFHSVGADIHYEIFFRKANHYWYFRSITDNLVKEGHAIKAPAPMNLNETHVRASRSDLK